ncbi:hypothetical protein [Natrononativus amylolyticus]|uniref:hypothetical protein n=1 Tax=Natrononativus amylolyticus TaxID=2963434 RepID=UPI0020CC86BE|nr:hypothetical protein [Natrononativus amylolyticus]
MTPSEGAVLKIVLYVLLGTCYAISGYAHSVLDSEKPFNPTKFGKTLTIGAVAGMIVAARGEEATPGAFEAAMAAAIPILDQLWNGLRDRS